MLNISINKSAMDPKDTFDAIVNSKEDGPYNRKTAVLNIKNDVYIAYRKYESALNNNNLENLKSTTLFQTNKDALNSMYSFENKELKKYMNEIMTNNNNQDDECPICQIDTISCFDHFVPKEDYPEFSINIHNLIPSCSICNNKKRKYFLKNNKRMFINIYIDKIPSDKRFLYLKYDENNVPVFNINNLDNMDIDLYNRLNYTFTKLLILKRYNKRMYKEIQILNKTFRKMNILPKARIKRIIKQRISENEIKFGPTHWETLLYKELVDNNNLFEFIINPRKIKN